MGCFCHATLPKLSALLPALNLAETASVSLPQANVALGLSDWLGAHGLPAAPWQPDPSWLNVTLPQLRLDARVVASISALAQLRAQAQALFGLDLLAPDQGQAFARIVTTMNARLSAVGADKMNVGMNVGAWLELANLNTAIEQVEEALRLGVLAPSPQMLVSLTVPGGIPMARWNGFLVRLRALAPMVAATVQLGVSITDTAQLSAALRVLAQLPLPALAPGTLTQMASLTAACSAVASLQASLGVSPLQLGLPVVRQRVQSRLQAILPALSAQLRVNLGGADGGDPLSALLALLPALPVVPTSFATSAVVQVALQAQALASLNWQIAAAPPAIQIGLPTCSFVAQMQAVLGAQLVMHAPCPVCDARGAVPV